MQSGPKLCYCNNSVMISLSALHTAAHDKVPVQGHLSKSERAQLCPRDDDCLYILYLISESNYFTITRNCSVLPYKLRRGESSVPTAARYGVE